MPREPLQILAPDGTITAEPPIGIDETRRLYRAMVAGRLYDRKCTALQKQGRLATYAPFQGQEAAQIGAAAVLRPEDWMVATYRDAAAMWLQGYPWLNLILGRTGDERGGQAPDGVNVLPPSITVGAHMIHAVGLAWGERLQGRDRVAMTFFGDGATSEGDFHEAMNFAAVYGTATVFICQNNGWAISLPRERQTVAETIADKAVGYGMPGEYVDGNDLFAMYAVAAAAVDRARRGEGPTLIEALTYRVGPHTTADDPGRYRNQAEADAWAARDPLERVRRYLEKEGAWDAAWQEAIEADEGDLIEAAVAEAEAIAEPGVADVFDFMFADRPSHLDHQIELLQRDRGAGRA